MAAKRTVNDGKGLTSALLDALPPIGDYLRYTVTVNGPDPNFQLVKQGTKEILLESTTPPRKQYRRRWPTPAEAGPLKPEDRHRHILGMDFLGVASYRFVVERFDADDLLVETILDVTWSSDQPDATRFETFTVVIAPN